MSAGAYSTLVRDSTVGGAMRQILPFLSVFFMVACSGLEKFDIGDTGHLRYEHL